MSLNVKLDQVVKMKATHVGNLLYKSSKSPELQDTIGGRGDIIGRNIENCLLALLELVSDLFVPGRRKGRKGEVGVINLVECLKSAWEGIDVMNVRIEQAQGVEVRDVESLKRLCTGGVCHLVQFRSFRIGRATMYDRGSSRRGVEGMRSLNEAACRGVVDAMGVVGSCLFMVENFFRGCENQQQ